MKKRLMFLLLFFVYLVASNVFGFALGWLLVSKLHVIDVRGAWRPSIFIGGEAIGAIGSLLATVLIAAIGRVPMSRLGYAREGALRQFATGSAVGLGIVTLLVSGIAALGGFTFGTFAMSGDQLASYFFAWLAAFMLVGVAEEMDFRAAGLLTLAETIGFWPAAIVTSVIFAALHYFFKPSENLADALSVGLLGLFLCYTVLRTGAIWFAIGFHALFDFAAIYMFGAPNSGNKGVPVATKMLTGIYHGSVWLTGGPLGVEASWLIFPLIALLFISFHLAYRSEGRIGDLGPTENLGGIP